MKVAITILNYKNYTDTINCIHSILASNNKDYIIIVVDNASNNDSLEIINEEFKSVTPVYKGEDDIANTKFIDKSILLVQNKENAGYAAGNNTGLKLGARLGCKYLLVLNNDTLFTDDCLSLLVSELQKSENTLCVGPLLFKGDKVSVDYNCAKKRPRHWDIFVLSYFGKCFRTETWRKYYYYIYKNKIKDPIIVDVISGSCMLFDTFKFEKINYFDEGTFLYYEEAIVTEKARLNNYDLKLVPEATLIHLGAQTMKKHSYSTFTLRCSYDSAIYYLTHWRKTPMWSAKLICLSQLLFIKLYSLKKSLNSK